MRPQMGREVVLALAVAVVSLAAWPLAAEAAARGDGLPGPVWLGATAAFLLWRLLVAAADIAAGALWPRASPPRTAKSPEP